VTADSSTADEPLLVISRPPRFWGSPFGVAFVMSVCVVLVGAGLVLSTGLRRPVEPLVTVKGIMASKKDFFEDDEVRRLLRERGFRVELTVRGSREVALEVINQDSDRYDFAFPSGQPAADLIKNHRRQEGRYQRTTDLFTSPIVLASYRAYAETLANNEIATAQAAGPGAQSFYYTLDTAEFIRLGEQRQTWDGLEIGTYEDANGDRTTNGNQVLAQTPGVCRTNSGAAYLGLIAFVKNNGSPPRTEVEADRLAGELQPLLTASGMPEAELFNSYVTPEGKSQGPIVVVYEHQYLSYQLDHLARTGRPDDERVLLYPEQQLQSDPEFISLRPGPADQLAELLATDRDLRRRMMQLGYRVFDATDTVGSTQLFTYLGDHGLPVPVREDATRALLPNLDLLESLIRKVGRCQS
jgi:hypothetical protein